MRPATQDWTAFFHITPSANNAKLVGQLDHAITDHEYPPTVWSHGGGGGHRADKRCKTASGQIPVYMGMYAPVTQMRAAVEAGHDRLGHDAGVDAEPVPELEFD